LILIVAIALIQMCVLRKREIKKKTPLEEPGKSSSSVDQKEHDPLPQEPVMTPHSEIVASDRSESIAEQSEPESVKKPDRTEQELLHVENVINTETELSCNAPSEDLEVSNVSVFENERLGFDMHKQKSGITSQLSEDY
jgi:hypothetical protein